MANIQSFCAPMGGTPTSSHVPGMVPTHWGSRRAELLSQEPKEPMSLGAQSLGAQGAHSPRTTRQEPKKPMSLGAQSPQPRAKSLEPRAHRPPRDAAGLVYRTCEPPHGASHAAQAMNRATSRAHCPPARPHDHGCELRPPRSLIRWHPHQPSSVKSRCDEWLWAWTST